MNPEQKKFIMGIIQKRMDAENKPRDPVKLLKDQAAERVLAGAGSRADSSMVGFPVSTLSPSQETKKKAVKKEEATKKKDKIALEKKIVNLSKKDEDFEDVTESERLLLENVPPDSVEAFKKRELQRQLEKLDIDSSKVKTDTKPEPKKKGFWNKVSDLRTNSLRKNEIKRVLRMPKYRQAKDNPQLQASIMKEELAKKGYSEEEIIEIIKGL